MTARNSIVRLASTVAGLAIAALPVVAQAGERRSHISPYIELDQTLLANLSGGTGGDDVLTYTNAAIGVNAGIRSQRSEVQIDARYEHQFGWGKSAVDSDIISGIGKVRYQLARSLSVEAGGLATRARSDRLQSGSGSLVGSNNNTSNVYSGYVGPTFSSHIGNMALKAAYRFGYARVNNGASFAPDGRQIAGKNESKSHNVTASIGAQPGDLPFGWSVGAGYIREDTDQFATRYEDAWGRGDITVPLTSSFAVVGGVGYEKTELSNKDAKIDAQGRYATDEASQRRIAYDNSAMIWDAGVMWRPTHRTSFEARVGHRYGGMNYMAQLNWQADEDSSLNIGLFDQIDSFGRSLTTGLANMPLAFTAFRNPFSGDLLGCTSGSDGGFCFNNQLAGISSLNYRHRGVGGLYSVKSGRWNVALGAGYSQRRYIAPAVGILSSLNRAKDSTLYTNMVVGRSFADDSNVQGMVYSALYKPQFSRRVANIGANVTYGKTFGRRLNANASIGVDSTRPQNQDATTAGLARVGMRYQF